MIRGATPVSLATGALFAVFVFTLKYEVQDLEGEFSHLSRSIKRERQAIHVLNAEWSHLNDPARLRQLAHEQMGLVSLNASHLVGPGPLFPEHNTAGDENISPSVREAATIVPLATPGSSKPPGHRPSVGTPEAISFNQIQATLRALSEGQVVD